MLCQDTQDDSRVHKEEGHSHTVTLHICGVLFSLDSTPLMKPQPQPQPHPPPCQLATTHLHTQAHTPKALTRSSGCISSSNLPPYMLSPPRPVPVGSPPCTQKSRIMRWNCDGGRVCSVGGLGVVVRWWGRTCWMCRLQSCTEHLCTCVHKQRKQLDSVAG